MGSDGILGKTFLQKPGIAMAAAAGRKCGATSCNAAAVKKKGVKVVHGKEIPWNLFSPKAPYQGKVVENDFHPQTLTEQTGDANWETTHVTFDHGGKAGYQTLDTRHWSLTYLLHQAVAEVSTHKKR